MKKVIITIFKRKIFQTFHFSKRRFSSYYNQYFNKTDLLDNLELLKVKSKFNDKVDELKKKYNFDKNNNEGFIPITKNDLNPFLKDIIISENNHPCFTNIDYVKRKQEFTMQALNYNINEPLPKIIYTEQETDVWQKITEKLFPEINKIACKEFINYFDLLHSRALLSTKNIPQISDLSNFLYEKSGFTITIVGGLLRPRFFLNLLAFKVFASSTYIRPIQGIVFNGEPDLIHEFIGHVSMFCDKNFADFSQNIGIASLGASDEDLKKLVNIYWFTIEYGLVRELNSKTGLMDLKIFGAGIIPSLFEIEYVYEMKANYYDLNFEKMQTAYYDYINLSTNYFIAESFENMKDQFLEYSKIIKNKKPWITFDKNENKVILKNK